MSADALLADRRLGRKGPFAWVASDYLTLREAPAPDSYSLHVLPIDEADCPLPEEGELEGSLPIWDRRLATLTVSGRYDSTIYEPDRISRTGPEDQYSAEVPWGSVTALLRSAPSVRIRIAGEIDSVRASRVVVRAGRWYVAVEARLHGVHAVRAGGSVDISARGDVAISGGVTAHGAIGEITDQWVHLEDMSRRSASRWRDFLSSCPVVTGEELAAAVRIPNTERIDAEALEDRQRWHWWAARANVVRSIADPSVIYVAPDRARWYGTWSSDAPITIAALALTDQRDLAVAALHRYVRTAIDGRGRHSWYTHPDGRRSLLSLGDTGVLSEGLPEIVRVVEMMDRLVPGLSTHAATDELDIFGLMEHYLRQSDDRDVDGDGLWETTHLWESGWDNKVGPMFEAASMEAWVAAMSSADPAVVAGFMAEHARPVATLVEQASHMRALQAFASLAERRGRVDLKEWAQLRRREIWSVVESRHWDSEAGIYRDWDAHSRTLVPAECLDAFYLLEFELDPERAGILQQALADDARFGLPYPPTLSRQHPAFNPDGYWDGSYWPREMAYLGHALARAGDKEAAARVIVSALASAPGSNVLEHVNPDTLKTIHFHAAGGIVYSQAMSVGLCVELSDLIHGNIWARESIR